VNLAEKYRPTTWEQVVGQDRAVATLRRIEERSGFGGRAVWISGPSGTGKTTIARIIAHSVADPFFTREYHSADQLTAAELAECERTMYLTAWGKGGRAFIINEAHGLRAQAQRHLDGLLEPVPDRCVWIFTTTWDGEEALFDGIDARPLLGRCIQVRLTNQGLAQAFGRRAMEIARAEGLDGQPESAYIRLMQRPDVRNSMRAALQAIEAGAMRATTRPAP
jgi:replication-associated recombination protein RarA